jgi:hypothetical protein
MESSFIQNKFNCYEENNSVIFKKTTIDQQLGFFRGASAECTPSESAPK